MNSDPPIIYYFPTSFYSQRVLLALVEKGVPYIGRKVTLGSENYEPWFMKINPHGQVPVLEDDGKFVCGSSNIVKYLDDIYEGPLLMPELGKDKWSYFYEELEDIKIDVLTFGSVFNPDLVTDSTIPEIVQERMKNAVENGLIIKKLEAHLAENFDLKEVYEAKIQEKNQFLKQIRDRDCIIEHVVKVRNILERVDQELQDRKDEDWLCGPELTVADVYLAILLQRLKLIGFSSSLWEPDKLPRVAQYYERLLLRKNFRSVCVFGNSAWGMAVDFLQDKFLTIGASFASIAALLGGVYYYKYS